LPGGYVGKVLKIDLTRRKWLTELLDFALARKYVGGYGTAGRILYDNVPPWVGPFDPRNNLIFSTGPITGSVAPIAGRHAIVAKSPMTGYFGDASSGGFWGAELKFAGYDMVIVTGRASQPAYLLIIDGDVEICSAEPYWGMDARSADRAIRTDLGDNSFRVADIGQAGEKLVRYAAIMNDNAGRAAARCGVGAVMGSKMLKAIAVRGHGKVTVADEDILRDIAKVITTTVRTSSACQRFSKGGTAGDFDIFFNLGDTPAYNWSRGDFGGLGDPGVEKMRLDEILTGRRTCYICPYGCRRVVTVKNDQYSTEVGAEGPEYEAIAALGSNCGIDDIKAVSEMNDLCNIYGLDVISTGCTIAFAMECCERQILTSGDTDGLDLRFGKVEAAIEMIHKIANKDGFGNVLADGVRVASRHIGRGSEKYAIEVKGLEIAMHDPRAVQSMGPHYACTPTGGRHTEGLTLSFEIGRAKGELPIPKVSDRYTTEGKAYLAKIVEDWRAFHNAGGWCIFSDPFGAYSGQHDFLKVFTAVTGWPIQLEEALLIGERIFNLKKSFNVRHGCAASEDRLPERLLTEKTKAGAVSKLNEMLPKYYSLRGWDPKLSRPTRRKLVELNLDDIAKDFWPD
jgi:aldehyde:ferredoxin oxidoreductase